MKGPPLPRPRSDAFTLIYPLAALAGCLWWQARSALDRQFDLFLLLLPVIGLPILAIAFTLGAALLFHLYSTQWRRAASVLLAGVLAWCFLEWLPINSVDWAIFELNQSRYDTSPANLPGSVGSRIKAWLFRDEGAFGSPVVETYVVYDESDELALPAVQRSEAWKSRAVTAGQPDRNFEYLARPQDRHTPSASHVSRIHGHWYFVELTF